MQDHNDSSWPAVAANALLSALIFGVITFLFYLRPVWYVYLVAEDHFGEFATFVLYFLAFLMMLAGLARDRSLCRPGYVLLLLAFFFIAMEEISWGQRILGLSTPEFLRAINVNDEITLHNMVIIDEEKIFGVAALLWAVVWPLVTSRSAILRHWAGRYGIPSLPDQLKPFFFLAAFFLLGTFFIKSDEIGECLLALGFGLYGVHVLTRTISGSRLRLPREGWVSAAFIVIAFGLTSLLVHRCSCPQALGFRLHHFAGKYYSLTGRRRQTEDIYHFILADPRRGKPDSRALYGGFLKETDDPRFDTVLSQALEEQHRRAEERPGASQPHRIIGKIYHILGRDQKAREEFEIALEKDRIQGDAALDDSEKAERLASLAETHYEMGDYYLAAEALEQALSKTKHKRSRRSLEKRIKNCQKKCKEAVEKMEADGGSRDGWKHS